MRRPRDGLVTVRVRVRVGVKVRVKVGVGVRVRRRWRAKSRRMRLTNVRSSCLLGPATLRACDSVSVSLTRASAEGLASTRSRPLGTIIFIYARARWTRSLHHAARASGDNFDPHGGEWTHGAQLVVQSALGRPRDHRAWLC